MKNILLIINLLFIYINAIDEYSKFQLSNHEVLLSDVAKKDSNIFYKAVAKKPISYTGSLKSKYCQGHTVTLTRSGFIENEFYLKAGLNASVLSTGTLQAGDMIVSVLHGLGESNKLELRSNIQVQGAMRFGSKTVNETIRQIIAEANNIKNEQPGTELLQPTNIDIPYIPSDDNNPTLPPLSFVEIGSMNVIHPQRKLPIMRQWQVWKHDDFEQHANGWIWSDGTPANEHITHCGNGDKFLAAHCIPNQQYIISTTNKYQNVSKLYENIPSHNQLEIRARVHFIDQWIGHTAYLKIDDEYVWLDTHTAKLKDINDYGINVCGNDNWLDDRMSVPISVIIPHISDSVLITFGSNVIHSENNMCIASLGIDDVMLYLRSNK